MVRTKIFLFLVIAFFNILQLYSQKCYDFPDLVKYQNISFFFGERIYQKAEKTIKYGNYASHPLNPNTYSFGLGFELFTSNKWSTKTGLNFARVPLENEDITILQKDYFASQGQDIVNPFREFSAIFLSLPLILQYKHKLFNNHYISLNFGGTVLFMLPYESYLTVTACVNENDVAEVYKSYLFSSGQYFHGGFTTGSSYYIDLRKILLEFRFIYTSMFQNLFEGEFQYGNLLVSAPTRGSYKISGDYLEFSMAIHFLKFKKYRK